jgi:hypothetical protein
MRTFLETAGARKSARQMQTTFAIYASTGSKKSVLIRITTPPQSEEPLKVSSISSSRVDGNGRRGDQWPRKSRNARYGATGHAQLTLEHSLRPARSRSDKGDICRSLGLQIRHDRFELGSKEMHQISTVTVEMIGRIARTRRDWASVKVIRYSRSRYVIRSNCSSNRDCKA